MAKVVYKSKCCGAGVRVNGMPDFIGSKEISTVNFTCLKCDKPCDVVRPKNYKQKACVVEMIELNLNDEVEFRLTKEGRKTCSDYRRKYRHVPLKKVSGRWVRVELWEFMYIFGSRMFMGANAVIVGNVIRIPKK